MIVALLILAVLHAAPLATAAWLWMDGSNEQLGGAGSARDDDGQGAHVTGTICDGGDALANLLDSVIGSLPSMDALLITASGNDGSGSSIGAPACNTNFLPVGASDDELVAQTNSNANLDLLALGRDVRSTTVGGAR